MMKHDSLYLAMYQTEVARFRCMQLSFSFSQLNIERSFKQQHKDIAKRIVCSYSYIGILVSQKLLNC